MDRSGSTILAYSEDRTPIHIMVLDLELVDHIAKHVDLTPFLKGYAMADVDAAGQLILGDVLPDQAF
jgi:hypothetical protein